MSAEDPRLKLNIGSSISRMRRLEYITLDHRLLTVADLKISA